MINNTHVYIVYFNDGYTFILGDVFDSKEKVKAYIKQQIDEFYPIYEDMTEEEIELVMQDRRDEEDYYFIAYREIR